MSRLYHVSLAQLRELETELRRELARLERITPKETAALDHDRADSPFVARPRIEPDANDGLAATLQQRALARRAEVLDALERLDKGRYGVCAGCRSPIPYGRLLVMPEAAYCVSCGAAA